MRPSLFRLTVRRMMVVVALFGLLFGGGAWAMRNWWTPAPIPVFLHPLDVESSTRDVLDLAGIRVKGCDFAVPKDSIVTVIVLARDQHGVIDKLSRIYTIADGQGSGRICMMRVDPSVAHEEKSKRVHWIIEVDGMKLSHWIDDPLGSGCASGWQGTPSIENPLPGKIYTIGEYKVERMVKNPGAPVFSLQIRLKFEPLKPTDQPGSGIMDYSEEFDKKVTADTEKASADGSK